MLTGVLLTIPASGILQATVGVVNYQNIIYGIVVLL